MSIFGPKNVNSVETTLYFESKTSIGCPFFFPKYSIITTRKSQTPLQNRLKYLAKKTSETSKKYNTTLKYPIIYTKKNVKKQPTSFFRHCYISVTKIQWYAAQKNPINLV